MKVIMGDTRGNGLRIGIAVSRFNDLFTRNMLEGARDSLLRNGVREEDITVVWVPGSYELPAVLRPMATSGKFHALIALGVVIQGATAHAEIIMKQVAASFADITAQTGVPIIDGVIGAQNTDQAIERSGGKQGNRGWVAAEAAIEMASVLAKLRNDAL